MNVHFLRKFRPHFLDWIDEYLTISVRKYVEYLDDISKKKKNAGET